MNERKAVHRVVETQPHERLDTLLRGLYPTLSRTAIQRLIAEGHIRVDGKWVKANHAPRAGESIEIEWPEAKPSVAEAQDIALDILHEDDDLLVVNKAPGMVVHPSAGHGDRTLVNALLHHCAGRLSGIGGVMRPGIVHRLDKDTSGCLVVARHDEAHLALAAQFARRQVNKLYLALVTGIVGSDTGEIRAAIARHPSHRKRMAVTGGKGRQAWTSYRAIERLQGATLVEARLHTGRTHQIRVHFQFAGHPLVGDSTYGNRQNKRIEELTGYRAPRQMLHAWEISFKHPRTGSAMTFRSPRPADFEEGIEALRHPAPQRP